MSGLLERQRLNGNVLDRLDGVQALADLLAKSILTYAAGDKRYMRKPDPDGVMPVLNVKTLFGAKGDGSTDDIAAIQDAADAANSIGSGLVYVPGNATYIIGGSGDGVNDGIRLYNNIFLILGAGAVLKMADGSDLRQLIYAENASHIGVVGWGALAELDGNKANQTANLLHGIRFNTCDHFLIQSIYGHDFNGAIGAGNEGAAINIRGDAAWNAWGMISNCIAENVGGYGIGTYRAQRMIIANCISRNNDSQGFSLSGDATAASRNILHGCHAEGNGRSGFNLEYQSQTVLSSCVSVSNGSLGGFRVQNGDRITIADSISTNDQKGVVLASSVTTEPNKVKLRGLQIYNSVSQGIHLVGGSGVTNDYQVEDCTVQAAGSYGIWAESTVDDVIIRGCELISNGSHGIFSEHTRNGVISGNICRNNTGNGIRVVTSTGKVAIGNNVCEHNGTHGIYVQDIARKVGGTLHGNVCHENSQTTGNSSDGINLTDCRSLSVVGNTCTDAQGTPTQRYGIREGGTLCDYNTYVGNNCDGNNTGQLSEAGANNKAAHNIGVATHDT